MELYAHPHMALQSSHGSANALIDRGCTLTLLPSKKGGCLPPPNNPYPTPAWRDSLCPSRPNYAILLGLTFEMFEVRHLLVFGNQVNTSIANSLSADPQILSASLICHQRNFCKKGDSAIPRWQARPTCCGLHAAAESF